VIIEIEIILERISSHGLESESQDKADFKQKTTGVKVYKKI
jgi:hypothetical protein